MKKHFLFTLLVGLSLETKPPTVLQLCKPGDGHAVTYPDGSFKCKPGPASRPDCKFFYKKMSVPFMCPKNGYYSGWLDIPPFTLEICCTEPGLQRKDCITYETVPGKADIIKPDRVIAEGYSINGGITWVRTTCRYLGYPKRHHAMYPEQTVWK